MSFSKSTSEREQETLRSVKFNCAAKGDDVDRVKVFLKRNPNVPSHVFSTAVSNKHFKVVDLLLSLPDFEITEKVLNFSFGDAILRKNEGLALRLLERGADPNKPLSILRETPLILAAQRGMHSLIRGLAERGARTDAQDASILSEMLGKPSGKTALMYAVKNGDEGTISLLISRGCYVNARGESGITALDIALRSKKKDSVVKLLRKAGGKTAKEIDSVPAKGAKTQKISDSIGELPSRLTLDDAAKYLVEKFSLVKSPHPHAKGVMLLTNPKADKAKNIQASQILIVGKVFRKFLERGFHVFITWDQGIPPSIALFSAKETIYVVQKFETASANYGVSNKSLIKFLRDLQRSHPLIVIGCGSTFVDCRFEKPIKRAKDVAKRLFDLCPFVVSGHQDKLSDLARHLEKVGTFSIWWD